MKDFDRWCRDVSIVLLNMTGKSLAQVVPSDHPDLQRMYEEESAPLSAAEFLVDNYFSDEANHGQAN